MDAVLAELRNTMDEKSSLDIKMNQIYEHPVHTPAGEMHLGVTRSIRHRSYFFVESVVRYYESVYGWIKANPSENDVVDAIKAVFVFRPKKTTEAMNVVNTPQGHETFMETLKNDRIQTMFLIGKRGSGKSFYLNYLMNTEIDNLYHSDKMVVYRMDVAKLYRHNIIAKKTGIWSLEDYLYMHIPYLTLKYQNRALLWQDIFQDKDGEISLILTQVLSSEKNLGGKNRLETTNIHEAYIEMVERLERRHALEPNRKEVVCQIREDSQGQISSHVLARAILRYTRDKQYTPVLVFDGIDNIDYHSHPKIYNNFIDQLLVYCFNDDKQNRFDTKIVISLRDETYMHLLKLRQNYFNRNHEVFYVLEHDVGDILSRKCRVAADPKCEYFLSRKKSLKFEDNLARLPEEEQRTFPVHTLTGFDEMFSDFQLRFLSRLRAVNERFIPKDLQDEFRKNPTNTLLEFFYDNNLRQLTHNFINGFRYFLFVTQNSKLFDEQKRQILKDYIIREGQLLNGNMHLDSSFPYEFGQCIPNMFWFEREQASGVWHGLCLYRLLQLLNFREFEKEKLVVVLSSRLNYKRAVVLERFEAALTYGLVTSSYNSRRNVITYQISKKGKLILTYPFLDIDVFYYMALDTPMVKSAADTSAMISYHDNSVRFSEHYTEACILTSITLIRHIKAQQRIEENKGREYGRVFSLPAEFPGVLISGMIGKAEVIRKFSGGYRFDALKAKIEGLSGEKGR